MLRKIVERDSEAQEDVARCLTSPVGNRGGSVTVPSHPQVWPSQVPGASSSHPGLRTSISNDVFVVYFLIAMIRYVIEAA